MHHVSTQRAVSLAADVAANAGKVIKGKAAEIELAVAVLLSGGHLLFEDVPGVGKTLLAKSLARSIGGTFRRIQATPDLLPTDMSGVSIYKRSTESWEFRPGPLFANVVLVDEINRATPRTQSALLEAMAEHQVTIDGATHLLPDPFFVVVTQNPFEHAGTFPLVEGQRDRFAAVMELGHPPHGAERDLLMGRGGEDELERLDAVTSPEALHAAIREAKAIHCEQAVADYVIEVARFTRHHDAVALGASARASLALLGVARGWAAVRGDDHVTPDHVKAVAPAVLAHRLILRSGLDLDAARAVIAEALRSTPSP